MALEIKGKLLQVQPEVTGTGKNGMWVKQEFIIETEDQYPKKACFSLWGDKTQVLKSLKPGMMLTVSFNIESREYQGRWFTELRAWKIDMADNSSQESPENIPAYNDLKNVPDIESKDDLPF